MKSRSDFSFARQSQGVRDQFRCEALRLLRAACPRNQASDSRPRPLSRLRVSYALNSSKRHTKLTSRGKSAMNGAAAKLCQPEELLRSSATRNDARPWTACPSKDIAQVQAWEHWRRHACGRKK
jgi:hypothetical protein